MYLYEVPCHLKANLSVLSRKAKNHLVFPLLTALHTKEKTAVIFYFFIRNAQCSQTFLVSTVIPILMRAISFTGNIMIHAVKSFIILKFKRQSFFEFEMEI